MHLPTSPDRGGMALRTPEKGPDGLMASYPAHLGPSWPKRGGTLTLGKVARSVHYLTSHVL